MVATKQTQKITPKVKAAPKVDLEAKAVEYRALEKKIEKFNNTIGATFTELKKEFLEYANSTLGDDEELVIKVPGEKELKIGSRSNVRSITDMDKAVELLGTDTFMKIAKIGLTDLDKYLTPEEVAEVTVTKRSDTRRFS